MPKSVVPWPMAKREFQALRAWVSTSIFQIHPACLPLNSPRKCPNDLITTQAFLSSLCQRYYDMVFKNIHSHKTAGLCWQWSKLFICLVLLTLLWDRELVCVCVYISLCCVSVLKAFSSLGRPSKACWSWMICQRHRFNQITSSHFSVCHNNTDRNLWFSNTIYWIILKLPLWHWWALALGQCPAQTNTIK